MSNIYIYKAGDGAGIAGGCARWTRGRAWVCALWLCCRGGWAGSKLVLAQLPREGGELSSPGGGGGVVPSAMLQKEVPKH